MNVEFRVYKLKEDSRHWESISKVSNNNEFIIVGEGTIDNYMDVLHTLQIENDGYLNLLASLKLDEFAYLVKKEELVSTNKFIAFNLPKEILSLNILEVIGKYNQYGKDAESIELHPNLLKEIKEIDFRKLK